jgi:hypothetical protein
MSGFGPIGSTPQGSVRFPYGRFATDDLGSVPVASLDRQNTYLTVDITTISDDSSVYTVDQIVYFSTVAVTSFFPAAGSFTFTGYTPTTSWVFPPDRISWVGLESLHIGSSDSRLSLIVVEGLHGGSSDSRLTTVAIETLRSISDAPTQAQITHESLEVSHAGSAEARSTGVYVEVLWGFRKNTGYPRITIF